MKCAKILLTTAVLSLGVIPQFPAMAANGEIACDSLVRNNGYSVISRQSGEPVYRNGRVVNYTYVYNIRNNNDRGYRDYRNNRDYRNDGDYRNNRDYRNDGDYRNNRDYRNDGDYRNDRDYRNNRDYRNDRDYRRGTLEGRNVVIQPD